MLAALFGVSPSTIDRAVGEVRPLLTARGFAVPDRPGIRLRTLADVFAYAQAEGITLRIDGTEVQVRRPNAGRPGRKAFVSGKKRQNTEKATMISDEQGRELWLGAIRPGRMHDATAVRTEGIEEQLRLHPNVKAEVDSGYRRPGPRLPRPGQRPAEETSGGRRAVRAQLLRPRAPPPIPTADHGRARQRRDQAVAVAATLDRRARRPA